MDTFLPVLVNEFGCTGDELTRALAQQLWSISQRTDRTDDEQALATGFVRVLNRVRFNLR